MVTTESIGCKDVVDDGIDGYLVPVRDSEALARKLRTLIDSKELRQQVGRAARQKAEREHSLENVFNTHLKVYN